MTLIFRIYKMITHKLFRFIASSVAANPLKTNFKSEIRELNIERKDFGHDFHWGVATASYQIEGAWDVDGKGVSIWDRFTANPNNVKDRTNGQVATDFYNRY